MSETLILKNLSIFIKKRIGAMINIFEICIPLYSYVVETEICIQKLLSLLDY